MEEGDVRVVYVSEPEDDSEDSGPDEESEGVDEEERSPRKADLPSEYWNIQKLLKYMKAGNQTATVISLACLKDHDFLTDISLAAIRDIGGLEILINLLETDNYKCILGSLSVLIEVSARPETQRELTELGAVQLLVGLLRAPEPPLQSAAATIIFNLGKVSKARKIVRKSDGIPLLVDLLDVQKTLLLTHADLMGPEDRQILSVLRGSIKALWSLSQSRRNKEEMRKAGCVKLLARLLSSVHQDIVIYTMGTIEQCSAEKNYRLDIQAEGMISDMVRFLSSENLQLKKHCAFAIFKCAEDETTGRLVREQGGLDPLVGVVRDEGNREDWELLTAATGAIWKCASSQENVRRLLDLHTLDILVDLLTHPHEQVLKNAAGALGECARTAESREVIRKAGGIDRLVNLLGLTNDELLENVTLVLGECAHDAESMARIQELDGIRLIWSLLKSPSPTVQAKAAAALVPCIKYSNDSGETVRSLVGGLELLVGLLGSGITPVLSSVCAALAIIAIDPENLAVITDHAVVPLLSALVHTEDDGLRENLALAIAHCCGWGNNCFEFGRLGAVAPLVGYMSSSQKRVHKSTALALFKISEDPFNCITLHRSGVVPYLLVTIASPDETLQEASAGCLSNIRRLALSADTLLYQ